MSQLILLCLIMQAIQVQFYSSYILASVIGSDIFMNLIMIGIGQVLASLLCGLLFQSYTDSKVFQTFTVMTCLSNLVFYFVPAGIAQSVCLIVMVFGIVG